MSDQQKELKAKVHESTRDTIAEHHARSRAQMLLSTLARASEEDRQAICIDALRTAMRVAIDDYKEVTRC